MATLHLFSAASRETCATVQKYVNTLRRSLQEYSSHCYFLGFNIVISSFFRSGTRRHQWRKVELYEMPQECLMIKRMNLENKNKICRYPHGKI